MTKQTKRVLDYLREHGSITSKEAYDHIGVTRLAVCIHRLRHEDGLNIIGEYETSKNRYGEKVRFSRYRLGA